MPGMSSSTRFICCRADQALPHWLVLVLLSVAPSAENGAFAPAGRAAGVARSIGAQPVSSSCSARSALPPPRSPNSRLAISRRWPLRPRTSWQC